MPWRCPGATERRLLDAIGGGRQWRGDNTEQYIAALISGRQAGVAAQTRASNTQIRPKHTQPSGAVIVHGLKVRLGVPAGVSATIRAGVCVVNVSLVNVAAPAVLVVAAVVLLRRPRQSAQDPQ